MNFEEIVLMQEQEELLVTVVEASRKVPKQLRRQFVIISTTCGYTLHHDGLSENTLIHIGDVHALSEERLLSLSYGSSGNELFDVSPRGYKFYEHLKTKSKHPLDEMSNDMTRYLDADTFRARYPKAYEKWSEAQTRLWSSESKKELTTIGHLCRESMQEFADNLIEIHNVTDVSANKSSTVNRIKGVLSQKKAELGETHLGFLNALLPFWGTVSDLVQRQEHGAERENDTLKWEDARLVTFQTMVVMYEIDRAIGNA